MRSHTDTTPHRLTKRRIKHKERFNDKISSKLVIKRKMLENSGSENNYLDESPYKSIQEPFSEKISSGNKIIYQLLSKNDKLKQSTPAESRNLSRRSKNGNEHYENYSNESVDSTDLKEYVDDLEIKITHKGKRSTSLEKPRNSNIKKMISNQKYTKTEKILSKTPENIIYNDSSCQVSENKLFPEFPGKPLRERIFGKRSLSQSKKKLALNEYNLRNQKPGEPSFWSFEPLPDLSKLTSKLLDYEKIIQKQADEISFLKIKLNSQSISTKNYIKSHSPLAQAPPNSNERSFLIKKNKKLYPNEKIQFWGTSDDKNLCKDSKRLSAFRNLWIMNIGREISVHSDSNKSIGGRRVSPVETIESSKNIYKPIHLPKINFHKQDLKFGHFTEQ